MIYYRRLIASNLVHDAAREEINFKDIQVFTLKNDTIEKTSHLPSFFFFFFMGVFLTLNVFAYL